MTKKSVTVIFIAISVFCLCLIEGILAEQNKMMNVTYELIAQPDDEFKDSTLDLVKQIDGVKELSYYMTTSLTLTVNDYSIKLNVHALSTDYKINDKYTLSSGLILNQAAIDAIIDEYEKSRKSFTDYYSPKYNLGSGEFLFNLDKVISNKDDNEAATAYISLNQMSQLMKKLDKNSEASQLRIKLINYSYLDNVKDALDDYDISITSDTNAIKEEAETYNIHLLYLSLILAVSFLSIIREHKNIDGNILIIGCLVGIAVSFALPHLFPPSERSTTVFGLSVSNWFYFVIFAVIAMIITLKEFLNRLTIPQHISPQDKN